jgi:hypothetical protein
MAIQLLATSHMRLRACDRCPSNTLIGGNNKVDPTSLHQWRKWMQNECKVYMDSYIASNGSCFMVTWTIFNNHLLEVGLPQNWETDALWNLTTITISCVRTLPGRSLPLIFCIHVRSGPIYWGGLFTSQKRNQGDGILHVKSMNILYVMVFYM